MRGCHEPHVRCLFYCLLGWSASVFDPCRWSVLLKTLQFSHNVPFSNYLFSFITQARDPFWISAILIVLFSFRITKEPFWFSSILLLYFRDERSLLVNPFSSCTPRRSAIKQYSRFLYEGSLLNVRNRMHLRRAGRL